MNTNTDDKGEVATNVIDTAAVKRFVELANELIVDGMAPRAIVAAMIAALDVAAEHAMTADTPKEVRDEEIMFMLKTLRRVQVQ